ncbi:MAG: hypothetical protein ACLFUC_09215 [Bacteroidales bacterium]
MNNTLISIFIITLFHIAFILNAQNASRGFKQYEKDDLEKAHEIFLKILEDDTLDIGANFGIALVYANENFARKNYFNAWFHVSRADKYWDRLDEKNMEDMAEFLYNLETRKSNRKTKAKFDIHKIEIEEKLIKYVREENDLEMARKFIVYFPDSRFYENVVHIRNYLEFRKVEKENTIEAYVKFINEFPDAAQVPLAIDARNTLAFKQAKQKNSLPAIEQFLKDFPDTEHYYEAIKIRNQLAFERAKNKNTIESYEKFITFYPEALQVVEAKLLQRKLLYEMAKKINTYEAFTDFIRKYPEGEEFVDVFNLKSDALGRKWIAESFFPAGKVNWARGFDDDAKNDRGGAISFDENGNIYTCGVLGIPNSDSSLLFINYLTSGGELIWQKYHKTFNHHVPLSMTRFSGGDLLAAGYKIPLLDTLPNQGWFIKMNKDGLVYWDKTTKDEHLKLIDGGKNFFVTGGCWKDTSGLPRMKLMKYKNTGRLQLERKYTGSGELAAIRVDENENILSGAGNWLCRVSKEGYLNWDLFLKEGDSLKAISHNSDNYFLTGIDSANHLFLYALDDLGNVSWEQRYALNDTAVHDIFIEPVSTGIVLAFNTSQNVKFIKTDPAGKLTDEFTFGRNGKDRIADMKKEGEEKILLLVNHYSAERNMDHVVVSVRLN